MPKTMTKYQLDHFKSKVRRNFNPLIEEQELLVKQYRAEATEKIVGKLAKKMGADKILNELSYRVKGGTPDLKNEQHLIKLFDVLKEHDWPIDERVRVIHNLTNEEKIGPKISQKNLQSRIAGLSSDLSTFSLKQLCILLIVI